MRTSALPFDSTSATANKVIFSLWPGLEAIEHVARRIGQDDALNEVLLSNKVTEAFRYTPAALLSSFHPGLPNTYLIFKRQDGAILTSFHMSIHSWNAIRNGL